MAVRERYRISSPFYEEVDVLEAHLPGIGIAVADEVLAEQPLLQVIRTADEQVAVLGGQPSIYSALLQRGIFPQKQGKSSIRCGQVRSQSSDQ